MSADMADSNSGSITPKRGRKDKDKMRSGRGKKERATNTFGFRCQIPWTHEETTHVKELLDYLTMQLKEYEGTDHLPQEETRRLLKCLQQFLMQDDLDRNDPLLSKIAYYFQDVQCVDLDKVASLLKQNKEAGESLKGQNVILLLGNQSSGKTTTLHCLAGTSFKETVVDGFVHLKPTQFLDATVAGYETSFSSRTSVTKGLQIAKVKVLDQEYVICDTPAFGYYDTIEEEIANKSGILEAICRAKSIRPVFVLSQECVGNRMSGLPDVFDMITRYFHLRDVNTEVIPFQYVFTRFDDRHRTRLWKMFKYYRDTSGPYEGDNPELFNKVVNDMIDKTNPEANVVSPISDIPRYLLKTLLDDPALECGPRESLKDAGPNESLKLLHVQLKLTLYGLLMFLACHDFQAAIERIQLLKDLSETILTAQTYYDLALKACDRYAIVLWENFNDRMEKRDYMSALAHVGQSIHLSAALPDMDDYIQLSYGGFWRDFVEIETKKNKGVMQADVVLELRDMAKLNPEVNAEILSGIRKMRSTISKPLAAREGDFSEATPHLMLLLQLGIAFPEAAKAASEMLDRLEHRIMDRVKNMEYTSSTSDLKAVGSMSRTFPDRTRFTGYAVKMYKHELDQAIDKNYFENAGDVLFHLVELKDEYNEAKKYAARGLDKLWKKFEYAIKQREYATAISIIKHLGKTSHLSMTAFERSRLGIEVIRDRLFKTIENKNYGMAQVLMQQLTRLERVLPKEMAAKVKAKKALELEGGYHNRQKRDPSVQHHRGNHSEEDREERRARKPRQHDGMPGDRNHHSSGRRRHDERYGSAEEYYYTEEEFEQRDPPERQRRSKIVHLSDSDGVTHPKVTHRHRQKGGRRQSDQRYESEENDDRERRRHRHNVEEDERDSWGFISEHRDDIELGLEDISDLTMSVVEFKKLQQYIVEAAELQEEREAHPPLSRVALPQQRKERRDPSPRKSRRRHESPDDERRDSPPRGNRNHRRESSPPPPQRKSRSTSRTKPRSDSPSPRKLRQATSSAMRRQRYESPSRKHRYESPPRRKRNSSPAFQQRMTRQGAPSPKPSQNREARKWFQTTKGVTVMGNGSPSDHYDAYDEQSTLPGVGDFDSSSFDKNNHRISHRHSSGENQAYHNYTHHVESHSRRSSDTNFVEDSSSYRKERLKRVDTTSLCSSEESGSWDI